MGIHHSPHTHTIPIPMGIPIPTAALKLLRHSGVRKTALVMLLEMDGCC